MQLPAASLPVTLAVPLPMLMPTPTRLRNEEGRAVSIKACCPRPTEYNTDTASLC